MEFDERSNDMRDEIYGSLTNEDLQCRLHDGRPAEDHLTLFHTRNELHINRIYWLAKITKQEKSFEGTYVGIKEECINPFRILDIKDAFGWNVPEILSQIKGPKVEIEITRQ
jgi:hypothetical protein